MGIKIKKYRKKGEQPMYCWLPNYNMEGVSVSDADKENGSPKAGDMIAINPKDPSDRWLVAAQFFQDNYEEVI